MTVLSPDAKHDESELLERYHVDGDLHARSELIERAMPLVHHIARRYANRGEPLEDLVQVGMVGLVKAVDRFDPGRGFRLSTFAAPNIAGEIKRHFRDRGWTVRPPRDVQELSGKITATTDKLTVKLQRTPTLPEIAAALDVTEEQLLDTMHGAQGYSTVSFEEPAGDNRTTEDALGVEDAAFEQADAEMIVSAGLGALDERSAEIVRLRFFEDLTQREIAEQVGLSQMHVSRLLRRALDEVRAHLDADPVLTQRRHLRAA